jgi:hypothetical protein
MGKKVEIQWEDNTCYVGKLPVASAWEKDGKGYYQLQGEQWGTWHGETRRDAMLHVEEILTGARESFLTWIDGEGFLDGVLRAWVRQPSTSMATVGTHYLNDTPRQNPLMVAQVFGNKVGYVEQAHCLTEDDAKRWCERVIREEKKP